MVKMPPRSSQPLASHMRHSADRTESHSLSVEETCRYIAEFTAELSYMAKGKDLDLLVYLLDMARLEALQSLENASAETRRSAL